MALSATVYNFDVALADTDRGVYETLALRVALHPSETMEFLLTRLLAYCLEYEEGITFSKGGIAEGSGPALWVPGADGRIKTWIEIGLPDAERLNKAAKGADRVAVYTHRDPQQIRRQAAGRRVHRAGEIEIFALDRALLGDLAPLIDRRTRLEVTATGGHLYVTADGKSFGGPVTRYLLE